MKFDGKAEDVVLALIAAGEMEVDESGRVWRLTTRRYNSRSRQVVPLPCERARAESPSGGGYLIIRVAIAGHRYVALAHRAVYRALVGPIPAGLTINHGNGVRPDNRPGNLEPATYSEQAIHLREVLGHDPNLRGERHPNSKLRSDQVVEIRARRSAGEELSVIAADFGIAMQTVSKIARGQAWASAGRSS